MNTGLNRNNRQLTSYLYCQNRQPKNEDNFTGYWERGRENGERGTENGERRRKNREPGTGKRETGNGKRETENSETGNGKTRKSVAGSGKWGTRNGGTKEREFWNEDQWCFP